MRNERDVELDLGMLHPTCARAKTCWTRHPHAGDAQARSAPLGHDQRRSRRPLLRASRLLVALSYLDTSALAKRYVPEVGSAWVARLCQREPVAFFM